MLSPNNDRLDYGEVLAPPGGYVLDFAVGTTYSLDMDSLVGACMALGLSAEPDSELMKNPICLLEALRTTGDRVALFCEGGQIHLPSRVTALYIFLEKMVFQVTTAKHRGIARHPSFHPKFWLIRYVDENGQFIYRVIVLSRNLTFDRSWDVTFSMDGYPTTKKTAKNVPVSDFLSYLASQIPQNENGKNKQKKIRALMRELSQVEFELNSKEFYDFDFIPVGVKSSTGGFHTITTFPLFSDSFHETLIMSPFLSNSVIMDFNNRNRRIANSEAVLITRASSLAKLKPADCSNFRIYTMKDAVIDGESAISEDSADIQQQDIHAKLFLVRKYSDTDIYLGSLNASHNALNGNIEFMIRLRSKNRYLNLQKLEESLFNGDEDNPSNPFQEAQLNDNINEDMDTQNDLDKCIKDYIRLHPVAYVRGVSDLFEVTVSAPHFETDLEIFLSPLLSNKTENLSECVIFKSLQLTQLSSFYKMTVSDGLHSVQRVIMIPTENLPDDRENGVISSVITDRACFYRYIAFLLGENAIISALETQAAPFGEQGVTAQHAQITQLPALYEKMLQTAVSSPERFKEIDNLIMAISSDGLIPEDFEQLYNTFRKAVKLNG